MAETKRFCKTMKLKNDPGLINQYKQVHAPGAVWGEVTQGMREVGIVDMEIYIHENQLFMVMETVADFDHEGAMDLLSKKPRQSEWEEYVAGFQDTALESSAAEKWQLMERIYKMD